MTAAAKFCKCGVAVKLTMDRQAVDVVTDALSMLVDVTRDDKEATDCHEEARRILETLRALGDQL